MAGIKKSKFLGQSQVPAGATLDYVSGGTNYKIDYLDFLQGLGVSGEIVQVGDPLQVPILDDQGAIKGIRNIRGANGVTVSIDSDNSIKISADSAVIGGIDWASDKTYGSEDIVRSGARYYISLVGNNLGNSPVSNPSDWLDLFLEENASLGYLGGFVTVEQYGAKGDGITDDGLAIYSAISATGEGGTVYFANPVGQYLTTLEHKLDKIKIMGLKGKPTILLGGGNSLPGINITGGTDEARSGLENLTIRNINRTGDNIRMQASDFPILRNVAVFDAGRDGVHIEPTVSGDWVENGRFDDVSVWNSGRHSLALVCPDFAPGGGGFINKFTYTNCEFRGFENGNGVFVDLQSTQRDTVRANVHCFIAPEFDSQAEADNSQPAINFTQSGTFGEIGGWSFISPTMESLAAATTSDVISVGSYVRGLQVLGGVKYNYTGQWFDRTAVGEGMHICAPTDSTGFISGFNIALGDSVNLSNFLICSTATVNGAATITGHSTLGTISKAITEDLGVTAVTAGIPVTVKTIPGTARQKWRFTASPESAANSSFYLESTVVVDSLGVAYLKDIVTSANASFGLSGNDLTLTHTGTGVVSFNVYCLVEMD